ncbi:UDP-glucuronic acid decarboxylase family protein [Flexibacterium corallicola]|uniref:UDP-glucuronic acid decarboxylase family protein n=1 Tax=Flexibacterium corallicola TaxID=3037259 RepID=UPI00286EC3EB|nr:SDR family oxidoreductase [Pseudovibrio sp. M1P-2-3]
MSEHTNHVLVTGGAGFIGSHLCLALLETGARVTCLDNLSTGQLSNITEFLDHPNFCFHEHDITDPFPLKVDQIYNLACPASPPDYQRDPIHTTKTCVVGSLNMLELARKNCARILQASTSEIYGDPLQHPQKEHYWGNVNPIGPRACYDEGKRCAETLFFDYRRHHNVDIRVVRIFNTYGPKMRPNDGRVVSNFISSAINGEPLTVYGKGVQTRSLCYINDLILVMMKFMALPDAHPLPLNIGNPDEYTILSLAKMISQVSGTKNKVVHLPIPIDDPKQRRPDISEAKALLDWEPQVPLIEGLQRTYDYFKALPISPELSTTEPATMQAGVV